MKPQKAARKLQKFQGRNPDNILIAILAKTMTPKRQFEINLIFALNHNLYRS